MAFMDELTKYKADLEAALAKATAAGDACVANNNEIDASVTTPMGQSIAELSQAVLSGAKAYGACNFGESGVE